MSAADDSILLSVRDLSVRFGGVLAVSKVGFDLRVASGTYFGATMRIHVMGNFDYAQQHAAEWGATMPPSQVFDATPDLAAQAQFYVRRDLGN